MSLFCYLTINILRMHVNDVYYMETAINFYCLYKFVSLVGTAGFCYWLPRTQRADQFEEKHVRFEILMVLTLKVTVFWVVIAFSLVDCYQHFGGNCCFLYPEVASSSFLEHWEQYTTLQSITCIYKNTVTMKNSIFIACVLYLMFAYIKTKLLEWM